MAFSRCSIIFIILWLVYLAQGYIPCDETCPDGLRPMFRTCECPSNCGFRCADDSAPTQPGCLCPQPDDCDYVECPDGEVVDENCACFNPSDLNTQTTPSQPSEDLPTPAKEDGVDYWGHDLPGSPIAANSADACAQLCASTAQCKFYSWNSCGSNECWLKVSNVGRILMSCRTSGRAAAAHSGDEEIDTPMREDGIGYWGNDLPGSPFSASSADSCAQLCATTPQCKYFSWNSCGTSECWLKTSNAGRMPLTCTVSGRASFGTAPPVYNPPPGANGNEVGIDYWGYDIPGSPFDETSASECARMCGFTAGCAYYTWDSCGGHQCWLKTSNADRRVSSCRISGPGSKVSQPEPQTPQPSSENPPVIVVAPPPPPPSPEGGNGGLEYGVDYFGNDMGPPFDETLEGCAEMCAFAAGCTHYTWDACGQHNCWLKTSSSGRVADSCKVSGSSPRASSRAEEHQPTAAHMSAGAIGAIVGAAVLFAVAVVVAAVIIYKKRTATSTGSSTYLMQ